MYRTLIIAVVVLTLAPLAAGQPLLLHALQQEQPAAAPAPAEAGPAAPACAPAPPATQPATQPTTQPVKADAGKDLGEIDLIKVIKGEKALAAEQILQLGYWLDFGKDFLFGIMNFVPRLFAAVFLF